jgi:hypothetical protein
VQPQGCALFVFQPSYAKRSEFNRSCWKTAKEISRRLLMINVNSPRAHGVPRSDADE